MRFGLLGCAAAFALIGTATAQAETIYVENGYAEPAYVDSGYVAAPPAYVAAPPAYVAAPSDYVYAAPAPRYVVTEPSPVIVSRPAAPVIVAEPAPTVIARPAAPVEVVTRPLAVAPRERFVERRVVPRSSGIVTTGYSASHSCLIDRNGFERCY
jgi:hypothetical protein